MCPVQEVAVSWFGVNIERYVFAASFFVFNFNNLKPHIPELALERIFFKRG